MAAIRGSGVPPRRLCTALLPRCSSHSWLPAVRFTSLDETSRSQALRSSSLGHGIGVRARASCAALRRRTPKQAENDLSEAGMPSEV